MSDTTYSNWYRVGAASSTNKSKIIIGQNSYWLNASLKPGDMFSFDGSKFYEIDTIDTNTQITLKTPYEETSKVSTSYMIIRNFTATLPAEIAAMVASIVAKHERYVDADMQTVQGKNSYEVALDNGFVGTVDDFLKSETAYGQAQAAGYEGTFEDWVSMLAAAAPRLSALESTTATHTSEISELKSTDKTHTSKISELESTTETHTSQISSLVSKDGTHDSQLEALASTTATHTTQISALQTKDGTHDTQIKALQDADSSQVSRIAVVENKTQILSDAKQLFTYSASAADHLYAYSTQSRGITNPNATKRNSVYSGKFLGFEITQAQWNAIANGTFDGLGLGDYWLLSLPMKFTEEYNDSVVKSCTDVNVTTTSWGLRAYDGYAGQPTFMFVIVDFNYFQERIFYNLDAVQFYPAKTPHIVGMFAGNMYIVQGNRTGAYPSNREGYTGSAFRTGDNPLLKIAWEMCEGIFGANHIFKEAIYTAPSAVNDEGKISAVGYVTGNGIELPLEEMITGHRHWTADIAGNESHYVHRQFSLFKYTACVGDSIPRWCFGSPARSATADTKAWATTESGAWSDFEGNKLQWPGAFCINPFIILK